MGLKGDLQEVFIAEGIEGEEVVNLHDPGAER
jgi:hypothetical protein